MDRINGREDVIDMRLVAGEPNRFERVTNRVHTLRRRLQLLLLVV